MNKLKRMLLLLLAAAMLVSMAGGLTGCGNEDAQETEAAGSGETAAYSVKVHSRGGLVMSGIDVYVYADSTLADLKQYGQTDENGCVSFSMPVSSDYAIVLSGVAKGYQVASSYSFSGTSADIVLESKLVTGESLAGANLGLGDVMYDFSVTTPAGETVTLSEMLEEKEVVVINFWYNGCSACEYEFPYMQEAYEMYSDSVGIIAMDPLFDSASTKSYQESMQLTFTMASCSNSWITGFNVNGGNIDAYPTTIIVDRYGVICLVEEGALVSLRYWTSLFEHFTGDDYEQRLVGSADELLTQVKPTCEMSSSEEIAQVINSGDIQVTYRPETEGEDAEYSWPFVITEKNGEACLMASNQEIESSFAILYADVYLEAGQALGFDYLASTEKSADILYVIVNDEAIYSISGVSEVEEWKSCYPWVALESGTYEVALCYAKDESTNEGDDTVYIKNMRVVDESQIDTASYIPRNAAVTQDGFEYEYVDVVLSQKDGYYHVGSEDGPLLLADLMNYTQFNEEQTIWEMAYNGDLKVGGHDYYEELVTYCSYASNSSLYGVCTVNEELAELLKVVADVAGFDGTENEWLKICEYFQVYGANGQQLTDPIAGLATFSAYEAKLGKNIATNYFYYDRIIMPRGLLAEFVPSRSGVYRITSHSESQDGVEAWIFNENKEEIYVYEHDERMYEDNLNVSMVLYMEAGKSYYIDIAFWDLYEVGYITYDIEYIGATYELFRLAAPGYFTYDSDATGDAMYYLISGGIDVVLGEDGKYYEDLGVDSNGKQLYGSLLYADFTGLTSVFGSPIATTTGYDADGNTVEVPGLIDLGGFDFTKTENDLYILAYLEARDYDVEATDEYLRTLWGEDYDANAKEYQLEDVYEGIYHGQGEDLTEEVRGYLNSVIKGSGERQGCVVVDERLAEILQMLMEKYTFQNVDNAWTKLCYYYDHIGPEG